MIACADTIRSGLDCRLASSAAHSAARSESSEPSMATTTALVVISDLLKLSPRRQCPLGQCGWQAGRGDQPDPGRLQPLGEHPGEPLGEVVAEFGIVLAAGPHHPCVELERLDLAGGYRAEGPPVGREQPGPAEQFAHADAVDLHPALPG